MEDDKGQSLHILESPVAFRQVNHREIRNFWFESVTPSYLMRQMRQYHTDLALRELQAYLEELPYVEGFKKKLEEVAVAEGFYEWTFYLVFSMLNVYVQTQVKCARGRADMVVFMPDTIYVMELKLNGTAQDVLDQINDKGYALRYATDTRALTDCLIVED